MTNPERHYGEAEYIDSLIGCFNRVYSRTSKSRKELIDILEEVKEINELDEKISEHSTLGEKL